MVGVKYVPKKVEKHLSRHLESNNYENSETYQTVPEIKHGQLPFINKNSDLNIDLIQPNNDSHLLKKIQQLEYHNYRL